MSDIVTRLAYKEDLKGMYEVERTSFGSPWSYDSFAENFYNPFSIYVLAQAEEDVLGFGGMQVIFEEAHVMNIAVLSAHRRKGIAGKILELMVQEAKQRGATIMFLEVRASNTPAKALYKKYGFVEMGIRRKYYSDNGEDAIIMTLEL